MRTLDAINDLSRFLEILKCELPRDPWVGEGWINSK